MPKAPERRTQKPKRFLRRDTRQAASLRGYDREWGKLRHWWITKSPLCDHCLNRGRVRAAREVDHKIPFSGPGDPLRLDATNLQSLCRSCHAKKTARTG